MEGAWGAHEFSSAAGRRFGRILSLAGRADSVPGPYRDGTAAE